MNTSSTRILVLSVFLGPAVVVVVVVLVLFFLFLLCLGVCCSCSCSCYFTVSYFMFFMFFVCFTKAACCSWSFLCRVPLPRQGLPAQMTSSTRTRPSALPTAFQRRSERPTRRSGAMWGGGFIPWGSWANDPERWVFSQVCVMFTVSWPSLTNYWHKAVA